ncbi:hypothetical protein TSAR_016813 [Trichomalopsis sarcophagae]|uniref:Uncharacterized protein n=1 Tax=Trichomalopsis sarcophagae TaxID=543379 RepID=A0A232F102_9HYME|nr:hypothetical protein TSAR_016813 [Trichomalopsis sarcophagae]
MFTNTTRIVKQPAPYQVYRKESSQAKKQKSFLGSAKKSQKRLTNFSKLENCASWSIS